jgi:hypothetical protein
MSRIEIEVDEAVGLVPFIRDHLGRRKDSRKGEVRCYTESGHRELLAELGAGFDTQTLARLEGRCPPF